jgi:hypothetical protein
MIWICPLPFFPFTHSPDKAVISNDIRSPIMVFANLEIRSHKLGNS